MQNKKTIAVFVLATALLLPQTCLADAEEQFVPHRAVYELDLARGVSSGFLAGAAGVFEFEWADVCEGWSIRHEAEIVFEMAEGFDYRTGWKISTWESKDGTSFRAFTHRFRDGEEEDHFRVKATLDPAGGGGRAFFSEPEELEMELPPGTFFPTAHSFALLDRIASPGDSFSALLFDGSSEEEGLSEISAIVERTVVEEESLPEPALFDGKSALSVHLAYFQPEAMTAEPFSEQRILLYGNGIVSEVLFDFGDFAIVGRLKELEVLADPGC